MSRGPVVVEQQDVARAWAEAFDEITKPGTDAIVPLIVCVTGFDSNVVREDASVRNLLDAELQSRGLQSIRTVASTIFPSSLWNPDLPASALFDRYCHVVTRLRKHPLNRNGIYFERMIDFRPKRSEVGVNQIDHILSTRQLGNHRRSAYQLSVIDPTRDHTNQRQRGFPCLQQVSVTPIDENTLSVTGFYATQTLFERAYGNYIGLCELGRFFAHEWDMQLTRVTCIASVAQLDTKNISRTEARALATHAMDVISGVPEVASAAAEG